MHGNNGRATMTMQALIGLPLRKGEAVRPTVSPVLAFYFDRHWAGLAVKRQIAMHSPPALTAPTELCGMKRSSVCSRSFFLLGIGNRQHGGVHRRVAVLKLQ